MIKCPGCGAALRFDPREQVMICDHCGSRYDPDQFEDYKYTNKAEEDTHPSLDVTLFKCPNCGAELVSTDDTAATFCSYCGSNVMMESRMGKIEYPTRIIPFRLNKEDAEKQYVKKLRESLFAPSDLKKAAQIDKFRGIYMPYWNYEYEDEETIHTTGSTKRRHGDYVYTKYYDLTADVNAGYDAAYFDASVNFADDLSRSVKPFDTKEVKNFNAAYMSGFYADAGDVRKSLYEPEAFEQAVSYMAGQAYDAPRMSQYGASIDKIKKSLHMQRGDARMSLFPVWFMSLRSRNGRRISYAAVNGQTGRVAADIPIDIPKYLLFSLILAIPIFLLMNTFLTLTPGNVVFISIVLNIIGLLILRSNIKKARETDERTRDKAYQESLKEELAKNGGNGKIAAKKGSKRMSPLLKASLIIFGGAVLFTNGVTLLALLYSFLTSVFTDTVLYIILGALVLIAVVLSIVSLASKNEGVKKMSMIKPVIGIIICAAVFMIDPVEDYWFYGAAIIAIALMLLSVIDIINRYNVRATHKMPQLLSFLLLLGLSASFILTPKVIADSTYQADVYDYADLLSDEEEGRLLSKDMQPLLQYGHIAFVSVNENSDTAARFAADFYHNHYRDDSGTLFLIDMDNRKIYVFSDGSNYKYITNGKALTITDNIYTYASREEYYECASRAFSQMCTVLEGGRIAEPMKIISNALISLLVSLLTSFLIVTALSKKKEADAREMERNSQAFFSMSEVTPIFLRETKTYDPITTDSGSSSGGGGFSSGGSSGGGGGGGFSSGGGGGHSF